MDQEELDRRMMEGPGNPPVDPEVAELREWRSFSKLLEAGGTLGESARRLRRANDADPGSPRR